MGNLIKRRKEKENEKMGANCFGGKSQDPPPPGNKKAGVPMSGAKMDRVTDTDKAIVDIKARQRKIRTYQ